MKNELTDGLRRQPCQEPCCADVSTEIAAASCSSENTVGSYNIFDINQIQNLLDPPRAACDISIRPAQLLKADEHNTAKHIADVQEEFHKSIFRISGLDCGDCAEKLGKRLEALPGVKSAMVNFGAGKLTVEHTINDSALIQSIKQTGYRAIKDGTTRKPLPETVWWKSARTLTTIVSGLLLTSATIFDWLGMAQGIIIWLYALAAIIGGFYAAKSGFYSLRSLSLDMNFLMTAAIIGAAAIGEWSEGAAVAFLFSVGNTLQAYTMDKTRQSIRSLMELAPPVALVRRNNEEKKLPV